jgi:hypothetical protein
VAGGEDPQALEAAEVEPHGHAPAGPDDVEDGGLSTGWKNPVKFQTTLTVAESVAVRPPSSVTRTAMVRVAGARRLRAEKVAVCRGLEGAVAVKGPMRRRAGRSWGSLPVAVTVIDPRSGTW